MGGEEDEAETETRKGMQAEKDEQESVYLYFIGAQRRLECSLLGRLSFSHQQPHESSGRRAANTDLEKTTHARNMADDGARRGHDQEFPDFCQVCC